MAWNDPSAKHRGAGAAHRVTSASLCPPGGWLARTRKAITAVRRFPLVYCGLLLFCLAAWLVAVLVTGGRLP
jgi:hypothetical protein